MNTRRIILSLSMLVLIPSRMLGVEILEADPDLSARIAGDPRVDVNFGRAWYHGLHPGTYMIGSFYEPESREASTVLGFRLTDEFVNEWRVQGEARLLFSFIQFQSGDPRTVCPIHIELLDAGHTSAMNAACRSRQPRPRLGTILRDQLKEDHLYSFPLAFDPALQPGDIVWIGLDCTNPLSDKDHNLILSGDLYLHPGGAPPLLVTGSPEATTHAVHGMSLLQSLNRRFTSPENMGESNGSTPIIPNWVNPFRTAKKLETLEEFRMTLEQQLSNLPNCPLIMPDQSRGFHSSVKATNETWTLRFPLKDKESSVTLYPAVRWNGKEPEAYAFPKRFIITALPSSGAEPVIVADWSRADFPQTGMIPVIFPFPWDNYNAVHITVFKGIPAPGGHTFALSEVAFAQIDDTEPVYLRTDSGNSMEILPYWSSSYATDGKTAFGLPIDSECDTNGTFQAVLQATNDLQIIIRQTDITTWDRLEFYPSATANGFPPNGFPRRIRIEFSNQDDFSELVAEVSNSGTITLSDADRPYVFPFKKVHARCVRLTLEPEAEPSPGNRIIQLEEITVNGGFPLTERRKGLEVELQGVPLPSGPAALYDRIINGQELQIPLLRRINLIRRNVLAGELSSVKQTMQFITHAHRRTIALLEAFGVMLAAALFSGVTVYQRRQSRKGQLRIRHRIQQDLHDEIGSQLSAISLIADMDKEAPELTDQLRTDLRDINQSAREAIASLAEVVWLTKEEILTMAQCFEVMQKRARQMVHTLHLELDFPQRVPDFELSYKNKRNLILLFTEALNNALKHSQADTIRATARLAGRELILSVSDNGRGFTPKTTSGSIGLKSMHQRAETLGGQLKIESTPGKGTTVCFTGKL